MNLYVIFRGEMYEGGRIVSIHLNYVTAQTRLKEVAKTMTGRKKWTGDRCEAGCDFVELQAHQAEL